MKLVILAAGQGTRLGEWANDKPKSLVSIEGIPYLKLQLQQFQRFSFSQKIIVGGYGAEHIQMLLDQGGFSDFDLVMNPDFKKGNLLTVMAAAASLHKEGFCLFNADHFYAPQTYEKMFHRDYHNITVCCDHDRSLTNDDMKVQVENQKALRFSKTLTVYQKGYVGVTVVPTSQIQRYWELCEQTLMTQGEQTNCEQVLNLWAESQSIDILDVSGSWWTEIDTPEDLENARRTIVPRLKDLGFEK